MNRIAPDFRTVSVAATAAMLVALAGCTRPDPNRIQGYVEGEYVYVASPFAGQLESLKVQRGAHVMAGDPLFELDMRPEKAARDEAEHRLVQARAIWTDAQKGLRPSELDSLAAQIKQATAALALSEKAFARQEQLARDGAGVTDDFDRTRAALDQDRQRVLRLQADLITARMGSREGLVAAAEASVRAQEAALAKADWELSQKSQAAPQTGLVYDTLFRAGEWVPAGRPVVVLLPPANIKVRAFVAQERIGAMKLGQPLTVKVDGVAEPFAGRVSFISPQAEFTPPVIYSRESRAKLVFRIEIVFDPEAAARLHPGQPVDVLLEP